MVNKHNNLLEIDCLYTFSDLKSPIIVHCNCAMMDANIMVTNGHNNNIFYSIFYKKKIKKGNPKMSKTSFICREVNFK